MYQNDHVLAEQTFKNVIKICHVDSKYHGHAYSARSNLIRIQNYKQNDCKGLIVDYYPHSYCNIL